jgi:UDP-GlcNAc3NAcA epimerase
LNRKKVLTVVGARPQFIKAAAVSRAMTTSTKLEEIIIHTGQHYDANMSDIFFEELGIPAPGHHLGVGSGSHGQQTGQMMAGIESVVLSEKPDAVLVYGDTNSTLAGALVAAKLHVPVVHSEAGLRSFNRRMPEEVNRVLTDHVSALLLCPTRSAVSNLAKEGIVDNVHSIGDVMYDAALFAREQAARGDVRARLGLEGKTYALCTIHRAENTDDPARFARMVEFVDQHAEDMTIVFPIHPRTRPRLSALNRKLDNWQVIDPLGYVDLHGILGGAKLVLTDSGGLQKEAYFHRKLCITLRDETEWVETVEAGWNRLWTSTEFKQPRKDIADYGKGDAAARTVELIERLLA